MKIKIAENIRSLRKEHSLTQEQLAEALGVTVGAVYKWEAGLSMPEIKLIMDMADFFEISVDVLLGYEQQNGNVETRIAKMEQYIKEKNFEEAITEAERALKKYPNHFEVVYMSAIIYQLKLTEDKDETAIMRSNELFRHAITLLYQNTERHISEVTILNHIAENYLLAEKTEQALESLKENNVCGINNSLIGFTYARELKKPREARPYLIKSFANIIGDVTRTMAGMAYMDAELKAEKGLEAALWLNEFLDSLKIEADGITFVDKLKAAIMAQCAVWKADMGKTDEAEGDIRNAYLLAKEFDDAPVYNLQGIRFFEGEEVSAAAYDDMGKTAAEAIRNIVCVDEKETEAHRFVRNIWEELEHEENR